MNRKLTLITIVVLTLAFGQTQCDPLKKAIEKHDVKTVQWFVSLASGNAKLNLEKKDAYLQLAKEEVERCKLAHESCSLVSIISELDESEAYSTLGGALAALGGIMVVGYWIHGYLTPQLGWAKDEETKPYKDEFKSTAAACIGVGTTIKGLGALVETFKGHKTKDALKKAEIIKSYIELLPAE